MLVINIYGYSHQIIFPCFLWYYCIFYYFSEYYHVFLRVKWYINLPLYLQVVKKHNAIYLHHCRQPRLFKTYNSVCTYMQTWIGIGCFPLIPAINYLHIQKWHWYSRALISNSTQPEISRPIQFLSLNIYVKESLTELMSKVSTLLLRFRNYFQTHIRMRL